MGENELCGLFLRSNYNNESGFHKSWNFHKTDTFSSSDPEKIPRIAKAGVFQ